MTDIVWNWLNNLESVKSSTYFKPVSNSTYFDQLEQTPYFNKEVLKSIKECVESRSLSPEDMRLELINLLKTQVKVDIDMVKLQSEVSEIVAYNALFRCGGDLVDAILYIHNQDQLMTREQKKLNIAYDK